MEERLKQRLIGGAVLVSLMVIFVPMLLEEKVVSKQSFSVQRIPEKPEAMRRPPEIKTILPKPIERVEKPATADEPVSEPIAAVPDPEQHIGKIERSTPGAWMVQVASFSKQENATKLVRKLKKAGMPAQMKAVTINDKPHYRVQMTPQLDKQEAENLVKRIKKKFGLDASVVRYTG
ncbi:MAG: SPOR domain-containing protein [Gammaproteobacteria bacterium]|nr:SPOR domain-containing protein [Gammaproteobacteria bacterium]